jgi:hypothetical protein
MCQQCPQIRNEADALEHVKNVLKTCETSIEKYLRHYLVLEDQYRRAGMYYHCTQIQARQPSGDSDEFMDSLRELFEITTVEEYNAMFEPLKKMVTEFTDMRHKYIRYSGTAEELMHRTSQEFRPVYRALVDDQYVTLCKKFHVVFDAAESLFDVSRTLYETDEHGLRIAWQDCMGLEPLTNPMPRILGEEWDKYRAWVGSLPETQRAVGLGRRVDTIALELLYRRPDGFIN